MPDELHAAFVQKVKEVGLKRGYETVPCLWCHRLVWAKDEIIRPNLEDESLKRVLERYRKQHPRWDPSYGLWIPPEDLVPYFNQVVKLGSQRGFKTTSCPHCGKLLWSKDKILQAQF